MRWYDILMSESMKIMKIHESAKSVKTYEHLWNTMKILRGQEAWNRAKVFIGAAGRNLCDGTTSWCQDPWNSWKSMEIDENQWTSMEINENLWNAMKVLRGQNGIEHRFYRAAGRNLCDGTTCQCQDPWKATKSMDIQNKCENIWTKSAKIYKHLWKSMKYYESSQKLRSQPGIEQKFL